MPITNHLPPSPAAADYRHTAIQDMLGRPPGWLLRSGLSLIALTVALGLAITAVVRYPETVEAPFLLQTETPPLALMTRIAAPLDTLCIRDGERVKTGDRLAVLQSAAAWRDVDRLRSWLVTAQATLDAGDIPELPVAGERLGSLQTLVSTIREHLQSWQTYVRYNGVAETITAQHAEVRDQQRLNEVLADQLTIAERELALQEKKRQRTELLTEQGVTSRAEYEEVDQTTLGVQRQHKALGGGRIQNDIRIGQLRQEMARLEREHRAVLLEFRRQTSRLLLDLAGALDEFEQNYVLSAFRDGRVSWREGLSGKEAVGPDQPIGFLLPLDGSERPVARCRLPATAQGKVQVGDEVLLQLDAYPYREFGQVRARVDQMAPLALPTADGAYETQVTIMLPDTLVSTYGRSLAFRQNATGTARIITEDRTLLQRLFDQLLNFSRNQ